jgi:hypothetical protein
MARRKREKVHLLVPRECKDSKWPEKMESPSQDRKRQRRSVTQNPKKALSRFRAGSRL